VGCQEQTPKCEGYQKSKEMSIKNIVMMSHSRISKQQRCCLRKHLGRLLKQQKNVVQEYHDDESFKDIKTTKVLFEEALR